MKRLLSIFAVLLLLAAPVAAEESPQSILASDEILSHTKRIELAESLLSDVNAYARSFPTLAPADRSYIEQEIRDAEGDRRTRLINSEEYLIYEVRQDIDGLRTHLRKLLSQALERPVEVKHWAAVAYHLMNSINDNHVRLRDMGVITQDTHHPLPLWAESLGRRILVKAIIQP